MALWCMYDSCIEENLMPESGIQEMENCMLCSTNIKVYRHPIVLFFFIDKCIVVLWIDVSEVIPTGTSPLRHCVGFSLCICSADRALAVYPALNIGKRALSCSAWFILVDLWKSERKLILWNWNSSAVRAVNERNRLTPISLA